MIYSVLLRNTSNTSSQTVSSVLRARHLVSSFQEQELSSQEHVQVRFCILEKQLLSPLSNTPDSTRVCLIREIKNTCSVGVPPGTVGNCLISWPQNEKKFPDNLLTPKPSKMFMSFFLQWKRNYVFWGKHFRIFLQNGLQFNSSPNQWSFHRLWSASNGSARSQLRNKVLPSETIAHLNK